MLVVSRRAASRCGGVPERVWLPCSWPSPRRCALWPPSTLSHTDARRRHRVAAGEAAAPDPTTASPTTSPTPGQCVCVATPHRMRAQRAHERNGPRRQPDRSTVVSRHPRRIWTAAQGGGPRAVSREAERRAIGRSTRAAARHPYPVLAPHPGGHSGEVLRRSALAKRSGKALQRASRQVAKRSGEQADRKCDDRSARLGITHATQASRWSHA